MRQYIVFFLLLCFTFTNAQTAWKAAYEKENMQIETRTTADDLFEFKAIMAMNHPIENILAVIRDHKTYPEWSYKTKELRIVEKVNDDKYYSYAVIDFPFPMTDRDMVMSSTTIYQSDKNILIKLKATPKKVASTDYVRIEKGYGFWKLVPLSDTKTEVTYQFATESNGLPNWVIETFALEAPKSNLKGLNERASHAKYSKK